MQTCKLAFSMLVPVAVPVLACSVSLPEVFRTHASSAHRGTDALCEMLALMAIVLVA